MSRWWARCRCCWKVYVLIQLHRYNLDIYGEMPPMGLPETANRQSKSPVKAKGLVQIKTPEPNADTTEILQRLSRLYPNPRTELDHGSPFQLLIATVLSAQSTDVGVNKVTPALFEAYPDAAHMAQASPEELEPFIGRLGLYRNKSKALVGTSRRLMDVFGGEVPHARESLISLPGVGRKTANVVMSNAFGIPAIAVDTHVFRVSNRLGLASASKVEQVEAQLMKVIPEAQWNDAHHWLILHGRRVCAARKPACDRCTLATLCSSSPASG